MQKLDDFQNKLLVSLRKDNTQLQFRKEEKVENILGAMTLHLNDFNERRHFRSNDFAFIWRFENSIRW
jgi:hypothetical protein